MVQTQMQGKKSISIPKIERSSMNAHSFQNRMSAIAHSNEMTTVNKIETVTVMQESERPTETKTGI